MPQLTEYEIHPAAELFPMMDAESFDALKRDIDANGVKEYIVLFDGRIIDGRNRYKAMCELGIDPARFAEELEECDDPVSFVLSLNLHRRHLNETQRATVAAKIATLKRGDNQYTKEGGQICPPTTSAAAEMLSVGVGTVKNAKHAIDKGAPAVVAAMESGELPASVAAKLVDAVPDKAEQAKIVKKGGDEVRKAIAEKAKPKPAAKPKDEPKPPRQRHDEPAEFVADSNGDEHPYGALIVLARQHDAQLARLIYRWPNLSQSLRDAADELTSRMR